MPNNLTPPDGSVSGNTADNSSDQFLLTTKLAVPPVRADVMVRLRPINQLQMGFQGPLTLIAAPAGFGKTTLLSTWIEHAQVLAAWVSLESDDDDLTPFWSYVFSAVERLHPGSSATALALLQFTPPAPMEAILTVWINALGALPHEVALVLDDYHQISAQSVQRSVSYLVDHLPRRLHLIIATRADPPFPLARLRARGHLTEVRAGALRFTTEETSTFLTRTLGVDLSDEDITALEARTEGWIAGLQLAALSMQGRQDIPTFLKALTGSHRYIIDYLAEEVLARQSDALQTFLLQTCLLERLEGSLCEAVVGVTNGQEMVEQLEQANLFLMPLDDERRWYRYHQLFAEALRHRLQRHQPALVPELHRRASAWYEQQGLMPDAIHHALAVADFELAARQIEQAGQVLVQQGAIATLQHWVAALPEELVRSRIELAIFKGWLLFVTGKYEAAERHLEDIEHTFGIMRGSTGGLTHKPTFSEVPKESVLRGRVAAIRASIAVSRGNVARTIALSHLALENLPKEHLARAYVTWYLGRACWLSGDVSAASTALTEAVRVSWEVNHPYSVFLVVHDLAQLQIQQGQLHRADQTYRQALQQAHEQGGYQPALGPAYVGRGNLEREWNNLDAAIGLLQEGIKLCEQTCNTWAMAQGYLGLAFINQARRDENGASEMIQQAMKVAGRQPLSVQRVAEIEAHQAWLALLQGNGAAVRRWVEHYALNVEHDLDHVREREYLTLVRVLIAQHKCDEAMTWLSKLLPLAETQGLIGTVIEILLLQATALYASDEINQAKEQLWRSLAMAEPEGYIRLFVDEGAPLADLLAQTQTQPFDALASSRRYREHLLALLSPVQGADNPPSSPPVSQAIVQPSSEALSERELDVLRLIIAGCSNREIAARLVIAVSTVKWHVNIIYGKLQVDSRTKAIARARELNIG